MTAHGEHLSILEKILSERCPFSGVLRGSLGIDAVFPPRAPCSRNLAYMDTNYCNLLNIWDRVFGTYKPEDRNMPIEYGITRPMKKNSFLDAYFGELVALGRDVAKSPGIKNKLFYIIMPPGWSHTGEHKMVRVIRKKYLEEQTVVKSQAKESSLAQS